MRVFRASYRDRNGDTRTSAKWYVELRDCNGKTRRIPGFTDKGATRELGAKLVRIVALRGAGDVLDPALSAWIERLPPQLSETLARVGILDAGRLARALPLSDLLDEFHASMLARGSTAKHANATRQRAKRVLDACRFRFWSDIQPLPVENLLRDLRQPRAAVEARPAQDDCPAIEARPADPGLGARASNALLGATRAFCRWMVQNGRAHEDPLRALRMLNVRLDRRRERRVLTDEDLRKLFAGAIERGEAHGMSGPERALLYLLAVETGLRASELASLRVGSFDLRSSPPTVTLQAAYSKRRREDVLPLRPITASAVAEFLRGRMPSAMAFGIPTHWRSADMLSDDLATADVARVDEDGRIADFHSLRHTFITNLARGGVAPKVAQSLARHSTISLTLDRYTHLRPGDDLRGLEALPDLTLPNAPAAKLIEHRATGTEGASVLASCLADPLASVNRTEPLPATLGGEDGAHGRARTYDLMIKSPLEPEGAERAQVGAPAADGAAHMPSSVECLGALLGVLDHDSPELARVVRAWPTLSEPLRAAILALVRASTGGAESR